MANGLQGIEEKPAVEACDWVPRRADHRRRYVRRRCRMTRVALDSNILIYAELEPESEKGTGSIDLILRGGRKGVLAVQVFGEFLRFIQRRVPAMFDNAVRQVSIYEAAF